MGSRDRRDEGGGGPAHLGPPRRSTAHVGVPAPPPALPPPPRSLWSPHYPHILQPHEPSPTLPREPPVLLPDPLLAVRPTVPSFRPRPHYDLQFYRPVQRPPTQDTHLPDPTPPSPVSQARLPTILQPPTQLPSPSLPSSTASVLVPLRHHAPHRGLQPLWRPPFSRPAPCSWSPGPRPSQVTDFPPCPREPQR